MPPSLSSEHRELVLLTGLQQKCVTRISLHVSLVWVQVFGGVQFKPHVSTASEARSSQGTFTSHYFQWRTRLCAARQTFLKPLLLLFSTKISLAKIDYMSKPDAYVTRRYSISLQSRDLKTQNSRLENWEAIHILCWHGISDCLIFYKV